LNVAANGAVPAPQDAGFIVDPEATVDVSAYAIRFDLTIPSQPSMPLSAQLSVDYERVTADQTFNNAGGPSACN
jgi:hypothetical protein